MNDNWKQENLGDITNLFNGKATKAGKDGNYPVYGSNGVIGRSNKSRFNNAIIIGRVGAYCGSVEYCNDFFWASDNTIVLEQKNDRNTIIKFLYYLLKFLKLNRYAGGAAQPLMTQNVLKRVPIKIPSYYLQKKIASILSAYDDFIENNNRRIEILEEMAQAIYKEWFVYFRFPEHKEVKMVDSELGKIPEGWKVKEIKNLGKIITGKTPSTLIKENYGSYMPFIKIPDMRNNMYIIKTGKYLSKKGTESQNNKIIPSNSLCVSCIGSVGIVSINLVDSQTNQQINSIVLDEKEYLEFLFFKLKSMKKQIENYGRKGATMNNLNKKEFSELKIMSPTKDLIKKFNELIFAFFEEIKILLIKNSILKKTCDLLLSKLISGEINVENLDFNIEEIK